MFVCLALGSPRWDFEVQAVLIPTPCIYCSSPLDGEDSSVDVVSDGQFAGYCARAVAYAPVIEKENSIHLNT